jgi:RNase H-fold protein (predicted Holliday junction resolvase)
MAKQAQPENERAIAFAQQMLARKKNIEKKMVDEYQNNAEAQAAVAKLQGALSEEKRKRNGTVSV